MLDPKEYATQLIEKYKEIEIGSEGYHSWGMSDYQAKDCALIDVQNTIDALEYLCGTQDYTGIEAEILLEHFNQVKEHIKQL